MPLLTKKQLAAELGMLPTGIQALTRARKIPVLRISQKTVRYDLERVKAALAKFEVKAVA
jgi:hypothetical protein